MPPLNYYYIVYDSNVLANILALLFKSLASAIAIYCPIIWQSKEHLAIKPDAPLLT
jgi:hypothetical protein